MIVGIAVCELHLPAARSLKQKRKVIHGLVDRIHGRYRISVAETDHHDLHQRAELGIAVVCGEMAEARRMLDRVRDLIDEEMEAVVTFWDPQLLEGEG